ncbi:hypothetical protein SAMN03080594_10899 [Arenibacter palladensis]|uniref:Beta-galactosidase trimerisation domain-containing protein n=1 Tax=Arenibacter palladensis TaxID=237373 RepID=A0A1M5F1W9_9FLAO|nr:hypothetical protein [Arenibacter palladensis]SHF85241.1 hypothetical protein SAMN03080594_10899 [Arenibacter palladensis]
MKNMFLKYFKSSIRFGLSLLLLGGCQENTATKEVFQGVPDKLGIERFNNITLEASLKPFKQKNKKYYREVAYTMYSQWSALLKHSDTISIMLWTADGSEILDYKGNMEQPLEWAKYIGNPNTKHEVGSGPKNLSIHERAYVYREDAPDFMYGDLKEIIGVLKEVGKELTHRPIRIGATFDPGPEFAKSPFKYEKHPEIVQGNAMGEKTFVNSYSVLKADAISYAGYPDGIPDNTPFGSFFGRQSQHFLIDLGFDYLWLSNGFGFGMEPWSSTGTIFTGKGFETDKLSDTKKKIIDFWSLFREECPDFRIETRGTNIATGIDLAKDGVDLRSIYHGDFNLLPPPNSPWAALDGDFGLELMGYMTRIADIPDNRYLFRYYTHDPWWLNSPWLDRYGREPHDIYLPMSISRIDENAVVALPTHLNFLTIDDSLGDMPDKVPNEVIPHILTARQDSPTEPGPLVWVYPFDEYHDWANQQQDRVSEMYYGDWLIRQAINSGLPLNTVISTKNILLAIKKKPSLFNESVLFSIVPDAGSEIESFWIDYIRNGGKVVFYGPARQASPQFLELVNLKNTTSIEGEFKIERKYTQDNLENAYPNIIRHTGLFSGGGVESRVADKSDTSTKILAKYHQGNEIREVMWTRNHPDWVGGKLAYVRGTNSSNYTGGRLLTPDNPQEYFIGPKMLRDVLTEFGVSYKIQKSDPQTKDPKMTIVRSDNGFFFSGYNPNTTVVQKFRFQQGAPLMLGYDTKLDKGHSTYSFPPSWHRECRIFVDQSEGTLSCSEETTEELGIKRRLMVTGLENATIRVYPPTGLETEEIHFYNNARYPWREGSIEFEKMQDSMGTYYLVKNITGQLVVSWE